MTERNGRHGRRYGEMTQQNQSPVVTDEELIAALRDAADWHAGRHVAHLATQAADRLEAALPSGVRVTEEMVQAGTFRAINALPETAVGALNRKEQGRSLDYVVRQILDAALSAIEPTQAPKDDNEKLERYDREIQQVLTAPSPAELKVVAMVVCHDEDLKIWELEDADLKEGEELCRFTEAQAAIASAEEAENEAKDPFWAIYPEWIELKGHGLSTEAARTMLVERAEAAEARVAELEKALKPFANVPLLDATPDAPRGMWVSVPFGWLQDARATLKERSNEA